MNYEYKCTACDKEWEEEQRITDEAIKKCPFCEQDTAKRLISCSNFVLKGGGWFKDGY